MGFLYLYLSCLFSWGWENKTLNSEQLVIFLALQWNKRSPQSPHPPIFPIPFRTLDVGLVSQASDTASVVISS